MLSVLTRATPRIEDYPFTTLHPNLGMMENEDYPKVAIADIPGLIEGASRGVGLGDRFLRHIERTGMLVHLIAPDPALLAEDQPDRQASEIGASLILDAYHLVRRELAEYSDQITCKREVVVLTKTDLLSEPVIRVIMEALADEGLNPLAISAHTGEGLPELKRRILAELEAIGRLKPLHESEVTGEDKA
jgi:GTP-binding protein